MRKITLLLITTALLLVGVGSAYAGKIYGKPSVTYQAGWTAAEGGLSGTMTWKGTGSIAEVWYILNTGLPTGDISSYTKIHVTLSNFSANASHIKLVIKNSGGQAIDEKLYTGDNDVFFNSAKFSDFDFTTVTEINLWNGETETGKTVNNDNPASVKVESVYMQKPADIVTCTGLKDEITSLAGITDGTKFLIANADASKAMYFVTNSVDSKNNTVNNVPNDGYYYYKVTKIDGLDTDGDGNAEDDNYTVQIVNESGTLFPNPWWTGGSYLNYSMYGHTFAATAASGVNQNYGWDFAYGGIWKISHEESGFVFQCAGKETEEKPYVYLKIDGTQAVGSGKVYLKLYKSISFDVNSDVDVTADENVNITVGGETRNYQLYVPEQVQENCPLVISLHGAGGASTSYSPFKKDVADAEGCIVAYPQGKVTSFPVLGNSNTGWTASGDNNFDVKFLKAVIEDVASRYQIDRKRIYCCGFSNGGMMTYALSNTCSDVFAAFASISGYPLNEFHLRHTGSRPVPFMHIHGKADDFVLYEKMPTIVDEMVARLGANPVPTTTPGNGYTKNVYAAGDGSFPYVYYEIDGMGHVDYTDKTEDGNSAQTMWNFFEQYTLDSSCDPTLKWAPRIEEEGYTPAEHGWTVNSGTTLLSFGGDQYTTNNKNVYRSLQFSNGQYKLNFKSAGDAGKTINVKIVKLTSPYTAILNANVNAGEDAELPFEVTDGWGEYKLTMTRPTADDVITVTDITVTKTGEASSVQAEIQNKVILTGGKFAECFTSGTYIIEMQGWQSFVAYEDAEGVAINDNSTMVFDMAESCSNGSVRVTFTFSDGSTRQEWWCLGIGTSADDASTPYGHAFDNSTYWLKKGLSAVWNDKKELNITKVTIENFGTDDVFTFKVNGGTICGQPMTIKQSNAKTFGAYGGEFSATSAQTNIFQIKNFATGDYKKMVIKFSEAVPNTGGWHLNNNSGLKALSGKTEYEFALDGTPISDFTIFNMNADPDPIKISEVYLYKAIDYIEAVEVVEAPAGTTDLNDLTGTNTSWGITYPKVIEGEAALLIGDGDGSNEATHVTITDYDWLCFKIDEVTGGSSDLRVWVWNGTNVVTLRPRPIADYATVEDWTAGYSILSPGTYAVKISDYDYLKGAKTNWGSSATLNITMAYLSKGAAPVTYVPSGKYTLTGEVVGSASLITALADANATYFDATGVTGTGLQMTPANPNALFKANAGTLTNTQNVIVGSTCANLVLTDNHPFKAPADFTATAATYTTTLSTAAKAGTLCLPFAATIPEDVTAYTLTYSGGNEATATAVETTIPANTPVLLNGSGEKTFTGSGAVSASATNEAGAMTGVFAAMKAPVGSYVLQNGTGGIGFYIVAEGKQPNIKPFRAYLTAQSTEARLAINFREPTGIKEVSVGKEDSYYNLGGQRVSKPSKGLYIVNGRKVMIK